MSYRWKKRTITLVEMLITLALTAVLLTVALGLYAQSTQLQQQAAHLRNRNFEALYLQSRLAKLFSDLVIQRNQKEYWFYTDDHHFYFAFDNGMDKNPLFGDILIGELSIDENGGFSLTTWPDPYRTQESSAPIRREILLDHVETVSYQFYRPPRRELLEWQQDMTGETPYAQWVDTWQLDDNALPAMIKVFVTRKEESTPLVFSYVIPNPKQNILYHAL